MRSSLGRFLVVGSATVLVDGAVYRLLLELGAGTGSAKTIGFLAGAVFAYVANWRYTFRGAGSRWSPVLFVAVYLAALALNVAVNEQVLALLDDGTTGRVLLAFLLATGVSATWNFLGMSLLVFRDPRPARTDQPVQRSGADQ